MNGSGFPIARRYRLLLLLFCGTMLYFFANVQRVAIPGSVFSLLQEELPPLARRLSPACCFAIPCLPLRA